MLFDLGKRNYMYSIAAILLALALCELTILIAAKVKRTSR